MIMWRAMMHFASERFWFFGTEEMYCWLQVSPLQPWQPALAAACEPCAPCSCGIGRHPGHRLCAGRRPRCV